MVNTNIQGVIPLTGRGFTAKVKRNYSSGEYHKLSNARLIGDYIQTRFNVSHYQAVDQVAAPIVNAQPFVGFLEEYVITVSTTEQWSYKTGSAKTAMWAPTSLPKNGHVDSFHKIVSVFEYDVYWNWLTWEYNGTTGVSTIWLYRTTLAGKTVNGVTFAMLAAPISVTTSSVAGFVFDNCFVFKERLWVCTNQGLFFSKATDFSVWAVPDGGFFKLRDQNINFAFSNKDNIFILCDSSVHTLSYSSNPNTDSYLREVSSIVGGDHGTSHNDQAFIVNVDGIYSLTTNSIDLVRSDFEVGVTTPGNKLISWENFLILIKYSNHNYDDKQTWPQFFNSTGRVVNPTFWDINDLVDSNVFFIDMDTGSCHTLDFNDQFSGTGLLVVERGHITDLAVNPNKSVNRGNLLTIMTNKCTLAAGADGSAQVYYIDNAGDDFFVVDTVVNTEVDNIVRRMKPNIRIEFDGYTPDGNEYMMKKFRSLELMGNYAWWDFEVLIAYDNKDYGVIPAIDFISDLAAIEAAGTKRSPYPARIGLNQRARSISIQLRTKDPRTPMPGGTNIYERFQITDMRVLWTYTGRGPTHLTQVAST